MGDFAAGKILDPTAVLLQLIEQRAPDLHATLQPVPGATADALAAAPAALRPFLAAHDGGWEIYDYVLCSCAEMAPSAAGLAIANHKFDEGDKLCLDMAAAACIRQYMCPAHVSCVRAVCVQCTRGLCTSAAAARPGPQCAHMGCACVHCNTQTWAAVAQQGRSKAPCSFVREAEARMPMLQAYTATQHDRAAAALHGPPGKVRE